MDYNKIAKKILGCIGGESNVISLMYCVTRLRFNLQNEDIADTEELKNTRGIICVLSSYGQYQVVIGSNVYDVYAELNRIGNFNNSDTDKQDINIFYRIIKTIAYFFTSVLFSGRRNTNENIFDVLYAPIKGRIINLSDAGDSFFASGDFGEGAAIIPETNLITSPISGRIVNLPDAMNAVVVLSDNGTEVLIHIGAETINLKGKYFSSYVSEGDFVRMGDPLIEFDAELIAKEGYDLTTIVVITNSAEYEKIDVISKFATEQKPFIRLSNKREEYTENTGN